MDIGISEAPDSSFLTLTISGQPNGPYQPGNKDPMIALTLSDYSLRNLLKPQDQGVPSSVYGSRLSWFTQQSIAMMRGSSRTWWEQITYGVNEVTYECDAGLGNPPEIDCLHIQWDQLSPASDTVYVGPGSTTFLHSSEFLLKISYERLTQVCRHMLSCHFCRCESHPDLGPNPSCLGDSPEHLHPGSHSS